MIVSLETMALSFLTSVASSFAWFLTIMLGTGDSNPITVYMLYASGIVFALVAGIMLGNVRKTQISVIPVIIGWLLALPFTPVTLYLGNPASTGQSEDDKLLILILGMSCITGILSTAISAKMRRRQSETLK